MRNKILAAIAVLALVMGACGGSSGGGEASGGHDGRSGGTADGGGTEDAVSSTMGEVPGSAADPSEADTEILVRASDDLTFDPVSLELEVGDVVTFVVRNEGKADHEFVLGDEAYQEMHEKDMAEGHQMTDLGNAVTISAGETERLTWKFTESGSLQFGCHEPGHYEAGMVGTIDVN